MVDARRLLMFYFLSHNCNSFDKISYAIPCAADGAMFISLKTSTVSQAATGSHGPVFLGSGGRPSTK